MSAEDDDVVVGSKFILCNLHVHFLNRRTHTDTRILDSSGILQNINGVILVTHVTLLLLPVGVVVVR